MKTRSFIFFLQIIKAEALIIATSGYFKEWDVNEAYINKTVNKWYIEIK